MNLNFIDPQTTSSNKGTKLLLKVIKAIIIIMACISASSAEGPAPLTMRSSSTLPASTLFYRCYLLSTTAMVAVRATTSLELPHSHNDPFPGASGHWAPRADFRRNKSFGRFECKKKLH